MSPHPSTLTLHRLRYGELSDDEAASVRAHANTCSRCGALLRAQENHRAAFELQPVPQAIKALSGAAEAANRPWPRWVTAGVAMAAALLLAVLVGPLAQVDPDQIRAKGDGATIEAWVNTPDGPARVRTGHSIHHGDRIQIRYRRPSHPWVSLAGVDASGAIEVYGSWTADMKSPDWQEAPFALELDDTPGRQDLVLVFAAHKPSESAVRTAVKTGEMPIGGEVRTVTLDKSR